MLQQQCAQQVNNQCLSSQLSSIITVDGVELNISGRIELDILYFCVQTLTDVHTLLPSSGAPLNRFRYLPQVSRDRWPVPGFIIVSNV